MCQAQTKNRKGNTGCIAGACTEILFGGGGEEQHHHCCSLSLFEDVISKTKFAIRF